MSADSWTGSPVPHTALPPVADLVGVWLDAMLTTSYIAMRRVDLEEFLSELATDLISAAGAQELDRAVPAGVGSSMVAAHFTDPVSLEVTQLVLGRLLGEAARDPHEELRVAAVLAALASGYAEALQHTARAEQEHIGLAAFAARSAAEQARWSSEARFQVVFEGALIGIAVIDTAGCIVEANHALCELLGFSAREILGRSLFSLAVPGGDRWPWEEARELLAGARDKLRTSVRTQGADGSPIWAEVVLSLVRDAAGVPRFAVGMLEDVTEQRNLEARLRHQAQHDPLTGLPNRTLFFDRLEAALGSGEPVGVCYLDLDGFKGINDTLGHDLGDRLLKVLADRLSRGLTGHLVARMGGDEFVILVSGRPSDPPAWRDRLVHVGEQALRLIRRPVQLAGQTMAIAASAGVVALSDLGPTGSTGAAELMKAADTTLYWAKRDGRDRLALFDAERHRGDVIRFALTARMPEALERGEFIVHYQPLVRLSDQRLVGLEALVRWDLPDGERLSPDRFIPLAEESGLIVPLGRWVLAQACRQAVQWRREFPADELFVSVNVAARQVREPGMVAEVAAMLAETGWPARLLQLELTESDLMGTTGESLQSLHRLAAMGVQIAVDDFGTGYSNLAYLRSLPLHGLKLAGRFVTGAKDCGTDEVDTQVTQLLIKLAHVLGLTVTAESVETAAQVRQLRELGCDIGQGWHYAPAVEPARVTAMLRAAQAGIPLADPAWDDTSAS